MRRARVALASALVASLAATLAPTARATAPSIQPGDWRTYGGSAQHTFSAPTTLDATKARLLARKWFFPTNDAVTANPVIVDGTVYVGSWDGNFYAINATTGERQWAHRVDRQPAVHPNPDGRATTDITSDGGIITSSAWFEPAGTSPKPLVIFGGGYTLYALDATDGHREWATRLTVGPGMPTDPNDATRIFSSPVVVDGKVIVGVTADGQNGYRGFLAAVDLLTGAVVWRFETGTPDGAGGVKSDGCGGVWTSPTVDAANGTVIIATADCRFFGPAPYHERVIAVRIADGTPAWVFTPPRLAALDAKCDFDFGASANLGTLAADGSPFVGVGGKDGYYYALDPATGAMKWQTNVVFGGLAGGFIGTTAFDGVRAYGGTALGDFPRPPGGTTPKDCFGDPRDTPLQEPSVHAFDAATGKVAWQSALCMSFGPVTVAGGLLFTGCGLTKQVQIRDSSNGVLINVLPLPASSDSGTSVVGDTIFFGTGSSEQGAPTGVYAYAPTAPPAPLP